MPPIVRRPFISYIPSESEHTMSDILTLAEAGALIAARKLSPVELTKDCLARVHAVDGVLNSFILLTEERALAEAKAAEKNR